MNDETSSNTREEMQNAIEDPAFSYQGYQVVRGEYFAHINEPSITLADSKFYVNTACIRKAPATEYVQVLVNSQQKKLAVRPCKEDDKDSFVWCTAKRKPKYISCQMFFAMIVDLLRWNPDYRYKIIGKLVSSHGELLFLFDLQSTEIYQRTYIINEDGSQKRQSSRKPQYPTGWKDQFGLPVEQHRKAMQVNIFDGYAVFGIKESKHTAVSVSDKGGLRNEWAISLSGD